jgi:hypothetical protein
MKFYLGPFGRYGQDGFKGQAATVHVDQRKKPGTLQSMQ